MEQIFAKVDTNAKVFGSSIDLCFQTLMIVHQQFNSRNITATTAIPHSVTTQHTLAKDSNNADCLGK